MQGAIPPQLANTLAIHPDLICHLMPLEQQAKQQWPSASAEHSRRSTTDVMEAKAANNDTVTRRQSFIARAVKSLKRRARGDDQIIRPQSVGVLDEHADSTASGSLTVGERSWLLKLTHETSLGVFIRDLV
jgi:hypothetical protein